MRLGMKERTSFYQTLQSGPFHAVLQPFAVHSFSIRTKILFSFFVMILLMGIVNASIIVLSLQYKSQYDILLQNITTPTASMAPSTDDRRVDVGYRGRKTGF